MNLSEIRSYRVLNMAIFDWVLTLLGAYILNIYIWPKESYWKVAVATIVMGIVVHKLLGIKTMLNYYLGIGGKPIR